jgi:hypothetical protein
VTLYFHETSFAGPLPKMPVNLFEFDCSFTLINGGLTDENFAGLDNLNYVVVSGLSLSSSIPTVFGSLQNLEFFYAADSLITGDLSFMEGMSIMKQHWVDDNPGLGGPLYPFIGDITSMISLSLTDNSLTGSIPTELGQMTNSEALWLFGNKLTGTVPSEIGNLKRLKFFQVEGNELTGIMPDEVCANTRFPSEVLEVLGADCSEVSVSSDYTSNRLKNEQSVLTLSSLKIYSALVAAAAVMRPVRINKTCECQWKVITHMNSLIVYLSIHTLHLCTQ